VLYVRFNGDMPLTHQSNRSFTWDLTIVLLFLPTHRSHCWLLFSSLYVLLLALYWVLRCPHKADLIRERLQ